MAASDPRVITLLRYMEERMFSDHSHDSVVKRGIAEALACQDVLERVPTRPSLLARLRLRLSAVRAVFRLPFASQPHVPPTAPARLTH